MIGWIWLDGAGLARTLKDLDARGIRRRSAETQPKRRMSWLAILPLILFVGLAGIFFRQLWRGVDPSRLPSPLIGKPAPEFNLPPVDGLLRDGKP
eukprot:gene26577-29145_t